MSKVARFIETAVGAAAGYTEARRKRSPLYLVGVMFMAGGGLLALTALGFGLAAVFWALMCLGVVWASLLTGVSALLVGLLLLEVGRRMMRAA